jgi:hypothetical protein
MFSWLQYTCHGTIKVSLLNVENTISKNPVFFICCILSPIEGEICQYGNNTMYHRNCAWTVIGVIAFLCLFEIRWLNFRYFP